MVKCFHLWEFYAFDMGDLSIENVNTAFAGTNEFLSSTKAKVSCCSSLQCVRFLGLWKEAVFTTFAIQRMFFEVLVDLLFPSHALQKLEKLNLGFSLQRSVSNSVYKFFHVMNLSVLLDYACIANIFICVPNPFELIRFHYFILFYRSFRLPVQLVL